GGERLGRDLAGGVGVVQAGAEARVDLGGAAAARRLRATAGVGLLQDQLVRRSGRDGGGRRGIAPADLRNQFLVGAHGSSILMNVDGLTLAHVSTDVNGFGRLRPWPPRCRSSTPVARPSRRARWTMPPRPPWRRSSRPSPILPACASCR